MKFSYVKLAVLTAIWGKALCCEPPNILLSVQSGGRGALGTQSSVEFLVPLYTDCNYQTEAAPVLAGANGPPPTTAITAHFPSDAFAFSGSNGLDLDSDSLNSLLAFFGDSIDANTLLNLVLCIVEDVNGNVFAFSTSPDPVFNSGAPIQAASYRCAITLGP